ncbi:MAG: HEAT repeat domain-containing protein [Myxococcota bacterium]|nr:HEAT repeat domain-containing protein [Myxococcota bacterium]
MRRSLFGSPSRRLVTTLILAVIFYGGGHLAHHYIDTTCASPGLSFFLVFLWFVFGVMLGFATVIGVGDRVIGPGFINDFLTDDMAELDARISGEAPDAADDDVDASVLLRRSSGHTRLAIYILAFSAAHLFLANGLSNQFIQRYSHPGVALIHSRSDDAKLRRRGLAMLTERLDFRVTPGVRTLVLGALNDTDEGVIARAAHVAAVLDIQEAVPMIERQISAYPALAFAMMIALGQLETPEARLGAKRLARTPAARSEPVATAYMLGLLRVPDIDTLTGILDASGSDENARIASVWALGQLRDARLLGTMTAALNDRSLLVRCVAIEALEKLVVTESAEALMAAFENNKDPVTMCPERNVPVQEGGPMIRIVHYRPYLLSIVRALATTDHPDLIRWLVDHQTDTNDYRTRTLMKKLWEKLRAKDARGELNGIKRRLQQKRIQEKMMETQKSSQTKD